MTFNAFLLWAFVLLGRPQDLLDFMRPARPALVMTVIVIIITATHTRSAEISRLLKNRTARWYLLFFLIMVLGIPFAYHRRVAFESTLEAYTINIFFFFILLIQVNTLERFRRFLTVVLFSAFFYSVFTLLFGQFISGRFASYSTMYDPNDIAYVLISTLPVSIYFVIAREKTFLKIMGLVTVFASTAVILLTGSRGGLVGLASIMAAILFIKTRRFKPSYKFGIIVLAVAAVFLYKENINFERLESISNISTDYNITDEFGRLAIWQRAWKLLLANPITGVGVNCFPMALGYFREGMGLIPKWQAAHNSYVQIAVETGFIGIAIFMAIIVNAFRGLFRVVKKLEGSEEGIIAAFILVAFIGHLITAFFLTQGYSVFFTLFFALSAALVRVVYMEKSGAPLTDTESGGEALPYVSYIRSSLIQKKQRGIHERLFNYTLPCMSFFSQRIAPVAEM